MAWRLLLVGALFMCFLAYYYITFIAGDELIYFTNEERYMTRSETIDLFWHFFSISGPFFALGLLGILFVPKR